MKRKEWLARFGFTDRGNFSIIQTNQYSYRTGIVTPATNFVARLTSQGHSPLISLRDMGVEEVRSQKPEWPRRTRRGAG